MEILLTKNQEQWLNSRGRRFTASEIWKLMGASGKLSQTAQSFVYEKCAEILTGQKEEKYSPAMDWGKEYESEAFYKFSQTTFEEWTYYGGDTFVFIPYGEYSGYSPDGLSATAILEIKCPYVSANHLKNLQVVDADTLYKEHKDYYYQVQLGMLATGLEKAYFVSYDPRMPLDKQLHVAEIERHDLEYEFNERLELANELMQKILK